MGTEYAGKVSNEINIQKNVKNTFFSHLQHKLFTAHL